LGVDEVDFGRIDKESIVLLPWGSQPEKIIGKVKEANPIASIKYFEDKFSELTDKVEQLKARIASTDNQGSFYMQLVHIKESLPSHDGLGDYKQLDELLEVEIKRLAEIISTNREKNTVIKEALITELAEAAELVSWNEATDKIKDIRLRWLKTGVPSEEKKEELENQFQQKIQDFFERRKAFFEDRSRLSEHHEKEYLSIIEDAKEITTLHGSKKIELINQLKERWKNNGSVPATMYQPLHKRFNNLLRPPRREISNPVATLEDIKKKLLSDEITSEDAKRIQKQLKQIRPTDDNGRELRSESFAQVNKIIENNFLVNLVQKRHRNFAQLNALEKKKAKAGLLRELLDRDRHELIQMEDNHSKFRSSDPKMIRMMQQKLNFQKQKISTKELLLAELIR
jgi:hypothetical protein